MTSQTEYDQAFWGKLLDEILEQPSDSTSSVQEEITFPKDLDELLDEILGQPNVLPPLPPVPTSSDANSGLEQQVDFDAMFAGIFGTIRIPSEADIPVISVEELLNTEFVMVAHAPPAKKKRKLSCRDEKNKRMKSSEVVSATQQSVRITGSKDEVIDVAPKEFHAIQEYIKSAAFLIDQRSPVTEWFIEPHTSPQAR